MDVASYVKLINEAAAYIRSKDDRKPQIAIILGSGLGKLADNITDMTVIPYKEIPGFPESTAIGHKGNLIIGNLAGKTVLAMQGRFHFYEGYTMQQVTLPQRVMSVLGIRYLFVSNAAGGLNLNYNIGDLMIIRDHINMAPSPLIGPNLDTFGPRFPDMSRPYSPAIIKLAEQCALKLGISVTKGVYVSVTGPTYETPSECHCYRIMGGDAIGMSTVPEVIVARHCGISVFGVSIITDVATETRDDDFVIDGAEVVAAADAAADKMSALFESIISELTL